MIQLYFIGSNIQFRMLRSIGSCDRKIGLAIPKVWFEGRELIEGCFQQLGEDELVM